ncbi:MAG: DNA polymerase I [Candidatus Omnitrophota bacterium]
MTEDEKTIYLIDANSLCYRAYYAIRELSTSKGVPTNAIYGVINMLRKLIREYEPKMMTFVFDMKGPTTRHEKYEEYKIHRKPMPDDLSGQMQSIKEFIAAFNIPVFQLEGYEADDIIATLAEKAKKRGLKVTIVTGDKDALQLVDKTIKVLSPHTTSDKLYDTKGVRAKYGVEPDHMIELMALMGDASDNIPGVKGVGQVTAQKLISKYGSVENIYKNLDEVEPESLRKKLKENKKMAELSRELVELDRNVPVKLDIKDARVDDPDWDKLAELCREFEFNKLLKEVMLKGEEPAKEPAAEKAQTVKNIIEVDESGKTTRVGFDVKDSLGALRESGSEAGKDFFDIMIADYLLDPAQSRHDLADVAMRRLECSISPGEESDVILKLYNTLKPLLEEKKLTPLFQDVEMPLVKVIADMEKEGVGIDVPCLKELSRQMEKKLADVTEKIYRLSGEEFNINSPKQLQVILFDKLGLPKVKKTKTGASTDESVLRKLAQGHELPGLLLEYRTMNKLKTGYYDSILELVDRKTGKLHAKFNQAVTATGRLSSSEPNLQNIPIKTAMGKEIRKAFVPGEKGMLLLAVDYSQIELRVLAHLSGDKELIEAFKKEEDVHKVTASKIFGCKMDEVTDDMRRAAKTVNFGIIYGMGPFRLAKDLEISLGDAQAFIGSYFDQYSGVKTFIDKTIDGARKKGYVTTLLNRRRYIPEITSSNERMKGFAERVAVNTPVQGSAADLIKLAMIACHDKLKDEGAKMIIQVHDELVFKVPKEKLKDAARKVKELMEGVIELKVPLKVDLEAGANWLDMEEA